MRVVVPSRGRSDTIGQHTLKLFPDAAVCVDESEVDAYRRVTANVIPHPPLGSLGLIRNWILDHVPTDDGVLLQIDDDMIELRSLTGICGRVYRDPKVIRQVVDNAALIARGMGAHLFGFSKTADIKAFVSWKPFNLNAWLGGVLGFVDCPHRFDPRLTLMEDVDFALQCLLKDRITFRDNRFTFFSKDTFRNPGGNTLFRSAEQYEKSKQIMMDKWGQYVEFSTRERVYRVTVNVKRQQSWTS